MNKMDLNIEDGVQAKLTETKQPVPPGLARKAVVYAAPVLVLAAGAGLLYLLTLTGPKPDERDDAVRPVAVQFALAEARPVTVTVNVQGEAAARVESSLAALVAGRIVWASPAFASGGAFSAGETLLRIDQADYELAVVRARAQVAQAAEVLVREEAEAELARMDWEELGQGAPTALALREPQLAQARASLAAAEAQLRDAELHLSRTNISAPYSGRVRARMSNIGDYVAPGAPVADVFSTELVEIRVPLTDANLDALELPIGFIASATKPGPIAHVSAAAGSQTHAWEGRLVRTSADIDPRTRLVYGTVEVRNPFGPQYAAPLAPGMFVNVALEGATNQTLVAAPRSALKRNEYVYVVDGDNKIQVRQVTPTQTTSDEVLFDEGVNDGERVVVSHLSSPRNGMEVTPINRSGDVEAQETDSAG